MPQLTNLKRVVSIRQALRWVGQYWIGLSREVGGMTTLLGQTLGLLFRTRLRVRATFEQMYRMGFLSLPLVSLTALFTGIVLALQSAYQLKLFGAQQFTADLVALSIARELGPVLTAMVVAGRVGAAIAAELGTMKVTEQIDALRALATDPVRYLVVPRFVAGISMLFVLTIYADVIGIMGGYFIAVFKLGINSQAYILRTFDALMFHDIATGLIKSFFFGGIIACVGCHFGFRAAGGAEGVGRATTLAVVSALILIIASDALFTALFYFF